MGNVSRKKDENFIKLITSLKVCAILETFVFFDSVRAQCGVTALVFVVTATLSLLPQYQIK